MDVLFAFLRIAGFDFYTTYYPASRLLLTGKSPYLVSSFNNPPWTLLPLLPFGLLPLSWSLVLYFLTSLALYVWVAFYLRAKPLALVLYLLSPPVLYGLYRLNIDAMVLMGLFLPAPIGLFFATMKPQMGSVLVVYWLVNAWLDGGVGKVLRTFSPVMMVSILSALIFGDWLSSRQYELITTVWNSSLWGWNLPFGMMISIAAGLFLAVWAFRRKNTRMAIAAGPFLSPFLSYYSWVSILVPILDYQFLMVPAVIIIWIAYLFH